MEFIKQTFTYNGISIEVNVSTEDKSIWLSQKDMGILFNKAQPTISRWINIVLKETSIDDENGGTLFMKMNNNIQLSRGFMHFVNKGITDKNGISKQPITYYNLPLILEVGRRLKSSIVSIFEEWCNDILNPQIIEQPSNIIKFDNGIISLDVRVEPSEKEVYLSQNQIAILFGTSQPNISMHITNIMDEGELDFDSVHKDFLYTAQDGKQYLVTYYNLDVILAVGYRVKSNEARRFRRWASNILESYLTNGYVIDKETINAIHNNLINLNNDVYNIFDRLGLLEKYVFVSTKVFYQGTIFDAEVLINQIVESAQESIVLIDSYSDIYTLNDLKNKKKEVILRIITSRSKTRLTEIDIDNFNEQYGGLTINYRDDIHLSSRIL